MPNDWAGGYTPQGLTLGLPIYNGNNIHKRRAPFPGNSSNKYQRLPNTPNTSDPMVISRLSTGSGSRFSASRNRMVPWYTGPHGPRRSSKRRRIPGPYGLLSQSSAARHANPRFPAPEAKIDDLGIAATNIPATGVFVSTPTSCINEIAQGTTNATRIGSRVVTKSVAYRLDFELAAATPTTSIRMILFWDRQPNSYSTALAVTDILATANYTSFNNPANSDRFVILRNTNLALATNGPQTYFLEDYVKVNMVSSYQNTSTNVPTTGALNCLFLSDQATNMPTVGGTFRVRFVDM